MAPKTDSSKLDAILDQLKALGPMSEKIDDLHASLGSLQEEVNSLQFTVNQHEDRLAALERDMASQKEFANCQQQQLRSLTIRFLYIPVSTGEASNNFADLRSTIYDRFLKPLFTEAKSKKAIQSVPPSTSVFEACFHPYQPAPGKPPPPVIIKLASRQIKLAIMTNRKALPQPTEDEKAAGISRFILVEDLTPDSHRALSALSKSKLTGKVWSVDGAIKFTLATQPNTVKSVKSVFDPISKMLSD